MAFTTEQENAIKAQGRVIVSASAGSGKTTVMIEKIIRLITSGVGVDEILAVTFTKKAAAQMKEKLANALIKAINDGDTPLSKRTALKKQLPLISGADISTIHSYCAKLIRTHFYAADIDSGFRVIGGDDADGRALKNAALDELLEEGYEAQDEEFTHLLSVYWRKKKDAALRKIILTTYSSLRDRADYREYLANNACGYAEEDFNGVCAELLRAFQEKCKYYYELVEDENAYFASTLDGAPKQRALCDELLSWLWQYAGLTDYFAATKVEKPELTRKSVTQKDSAEKRAHIERLAFLKDRIVEMQKKEFSTLLTREEELRNFLISGKTASALASYLLRFDEKYTALKREKGVLDYNDLEHVALSLLKNPDIAEETQKKYRYVFVDEYQDVNPVQEEIIARLSLENLFLVGDVKQSIYGFRGSRSKYFVETQKRFEKAGEKEDSHSLYMRNNFRSEDKVLDAVNGLFSRIMTKQNGEIAYFPDSVMQKGGLYAPESGAVKIYFTPKPEKGKSLPRGVYSVMQHAEGEEKEALPQAKYLAQVIQDELKYGLLDNPKTGERRPVRYSDIAILSRKNGGDISKEVAELSALGLPVTATSSVNVCEFSEVKALMDILSLLDNEEQDIPLCSALLSGMGKCTADDLAEIRLAYRSGSFRFACKQYAREKQDGLADKLRAFYEYFHTLRTQSSVLSAGEVLAKILADTQMEAGLLSRKNGTACLKRIRRFIEEASAFDGYSVCEFLEHLKNLDYKIEYSENGGEDSIKVLTMHASKGLEFPIVLLPNLSQKFGGGEAVDVCVEEEYGLAPRAFDSEKMLRRNTVLRRLCEEKEDRSALQDELNLYYVALTRAEQRLHLFFDERPPMPDVRYATSFAELTDFSVWEEYVVDEAIFDLEKQTRQPLLQKADEKTVAAIVEAFTWKYKHTGYENLPVKSSPTELMADGKYIPKPTFTSFGKEDEEEIEADRGLAVREGTAYHAFLERFDFSSLIDEKGIAVEKSALAARIEETLSRINPREVEIELLSKEKLTEILSNPVFYELRDMRLYKEQQFLVFLPVKDTYAKKEGVQLPLTAEKGEEMLFQGAIDLLAVGEEVRIIDYKYSARDGEALKTHYKPQLDLYKLAVAKILKIPAESIRCSIVNIRRGFQVDID